MGTTKPKVTEVMSKGRACCAFKTPEEAEQAIAIVNGSDLEGATIEVDVWIQKEKNDKEEKKQKPNSEKIAKLVKNMLGKNGVKKPDSKITAKMKETDPSLKVWIGSLSPKTTWKKSRSILKKMVVNLRQPIYCRNREPLFVHLRTSPMSPTQLPA